MADTWQCPTCGKKYTADVTMCRNCRSPSMIKPGGLTGGRPLRRTKSEATLRLTKPSEPKPPPPPSPNEPESRVEVRFPYVLKNARYSVPAITGDEWTDGTIVAVEQGLYFISALDALDAKEMGHQPVPPDGHLARLSLFLSTGSILRVARKDAPAGPFLEALRGRLPLDFSDDVWEEFDIICRSLKIQRS